MFACINISPSQPFSLHPPISAITISSGLRQGLGSGVLIDNQTIDRDECACYRGGGEDHRHAVRRNTRPGCVGGK